MCLPIVFGCPTRISQEGDQTPRVCPRCHNASVIRAKSRMWFELFFIPLIPMPSSRIWLCTICHWEIDQQPNYEPPLPQLGYTRPGQHHQPPQNPQPVYGYGVGTKGAT